MKKTAVNLIIHGHFYQPPREDPWTDQIGFQPSAYPYKNWNYRITSECYAPNCFSRVLDSHGRIIEIINNYKYISFNFGPTLLSWLEKKEKEIYELILEADRESIKEHNGHGNAIAQIYNHVIMPLQSKRDKITEIIWGLEDFKYRFRRDSEGIWLSETAVDYETIDLLIDFGVKFIILSPSQAKSYRKIGEVEWTENNEKTPIPTTRAYKIIREHGSIAVLFFNKRLSTAVSFEHLLHNADNLATTILNSSTKDDDLILIATDGEVYGHHEPFADMCLARLISEYYLKEKKIRLLNCAEYLEIFPVEYEVTLNLGEDGRGSSWSCFHGVGRWYKDCGCHTGGQPDWNQKWRGPLRDAFDYLKEKIDEIFEKTLFNYTNEPWKLRDNYIYYLLNLYLYKEFIEKYIGKKLNDDEYEKILSLLEAQKNTLFMYTSCGWFFSEVSGIETVQNIKYAYKAIYLLKKFFETEYNEIKNNFEEKIALAKSNIPNIQDARWILYNWIYPHIQNLSHIANNILALIFLVKQPKFEEIEIFETYSFELINIKEEAEYFSGSLKVYHRNRYLNGVYSFIFVKKGSLEFKSYIIEKEKEFILDEIKSDLINKIEHEEYYKNNDVRIYTEEDLANEVKDYILKFNYDKNIPELIMITDKIYNNIRYTLLFYKKNRLALSEILKTELKFIVETYFYFIANNLNDFPIKETYKKLFELFDFTNAFKLEVNMNELLGSLAKLLYKKMQEIDPFDFESEIYKKILVLLEFSYRVGIKIEKARCENIVFKLLKETSNNLIKNIQEADNDIERSRYLIRFRDLIEIADMFNIDTTKEKENFFTQFKEFKRNFF